MNLKDSENKFSNFSNQNEDNLKEKFLILKISFDKLGFEESIIKILQNNGFDFLSDLIGFDKEDFLQFSGFDLEKFDTLTSRFNKNNLKIPLTFDQASNIHGREKFKSITKDSHISFQEIKNKFLTKEIDIDNFENAFKHIYIKGYDPEFVLIFNILKIIESADSGFNKENKDFTFEKRFIKFYFLKNVFDEQSTINIQSLEKIFNTFSSSPNSVDRLYFLFCKLSGMTLQSIGDQKGCSRENIRSRIKTISIMFGLEGIDLEELFRKFKENSKYNSTKIMIDQLLDEFNRLPNKNDASEKFNADDPIYKSIIELNLKDRLVCYEEFKKEIPNSEYDFHFESIINKVEIDKGFGYWLNFENLEQFLKRFASYLGEPDYMPMQKDSPDWIRGIIQRHGGQSVVAKKTGLKYQGQLVSESGKRRFWTYEQMSDLIDKVNIFYSQVNNKMPSFSQIKDFLKNTDNELYKNKKSGSLLSAMTSMGNLTWTETAEKFNRRIILDKSVRVNTNFVKAFVRDLGEHLAVLTPSELYVLFQAQGISKDKSRHSRTFDILIEAVQSGEVDKKDLVDWSNNIEVPSIVNLLNLGSELSSRNTNKEERELVLLNRRSRRIEANKIKPKIIDLNKVTSEDLPALDPIKSLSALDKAASIITESNSDLELIEFLKAKATAKLWDSCFSDENLLIKNLKSSFFEKDEYSSRVKEAFLEEYNGANNLEIPQTYKFRDLKGIERQPKLMQKLVAFRLLRDKRLLNLSGTGTGKTLSAILSAQICSSQRIFISCPNGVVDSWERSFQSAYPSAVIHIKPENWEINLIENKTNVVVVNHERFQNRFSENLLRFCVEFQPDLIVIDEIHQSKSREEKISSQRRSLLGELIRISSNINQELRVLGLSATPVINNLYEGASLIELITQKKFEGIKENNINSCMHLYQNFILHGIRMNPGSLSRTKLIPIQIDSSALLPEVIEITNSRRHTSYHEIEKILVKPKLQILKRILSENSKTIIFITYIKGTLIPITDFLSHERISYSVYTGEDKEATDSGFKDSLDEFINGNTKVLVASIQCAGTGIDGLQSVCSNAIFFQLPWTSTEFEQSIGRLDRDGTEFDSINVFMPITNIKLPNGENWSWCQSKLERIESKKDIAKAAVDGDLPDSGAILSPQDATKLWLKWLKRLENSPND